MVQCVKCDSENTEKIIIDKVSYIFCRSCKYTDLDFINYEENIKRLNEISKNTVENRNKKTFNQQVIRLFRTVKTLEQDKKNLGRLIQHLISKINELEERITLIENIDITTIITNTVRSELNE